VYFEEKPIRIALCIDVILENKMKFSRWRLQLLKNIH